MGRIGWAKNYRNGRSWVVNVGLLVKRFIKEQADAANFGCYRWIFSRRGCRIKMRGVEVSATPNYVVNGGGSGGHNGDDF